ncbi:hypothetical protein DH2020_023421 [Rehmannia glutinosa]|uniref:Uncharacterized protein n=1 Tax=Rehmannia glutinosa TaxID=99300 RepID=A0ABR0W8D2_REHGL
MSRRVLRKVVGRGKEKVDFPESDENLTLDEKEVLDWTRLPDDTVIAIFSSASSLASRCENLRKLRFRDPESADAIINLQAKNLRELSVECGRKMTDATLCALAARHEALECLQIGGYFLRMSRRISSDAVKATAICCPQLRKLRISGIWELEVDANAINALAKNCPNLTDIGFINCRKVDETALGNVASVRFLSVAWTTNIKWNLVAQQWSKLPHLIGLDVSGTDIPPNNVSGLFSSSFSLKVLCALNCPALEEDATFVSNNNREGKVLLAVFTDILKGVAKLFTDTPKNDRNIFLHWRNSKKDKILGEILNWLEWIICNGLLRVSACNPPSFDNFWLKQGTTLLLSFLQSAQEEVQERAATALATFVAIYDDNFSIDTERAEAVIQDDGIRLLLNLAQSWQEGLQSEAAKAIASLSLNAKAAKAVVELGGIRTLANLARSFNRLVAEEAAGALWNLSFREELKAARALTNLAAHWDTNGHDSAVGQEAGALDALVQLTRSRHDGVRYYFPAEGKKLLAHYGIYPMTTEIEKKFAAAGGVEALVALANSCSNASPGLQLRAAGALWGLSESEAYSIAIGRGGGVAPLIALAQSNAEDVHEVAAGALWNFAFYPSNALHIMEEDGIHALAHLCSSSVSKMARFMSALTLAYMFDGRIDDIALNGTPTDGTSKA